MTTGPYLGTAQTQEEVYRVALLVGFEHQPNVSSSFVTHTEVDKLGLQIHNPSHFPDVRDIVTEIEFDDHSDRFPINPEAASVLRDMYQRLPDLVYIINEGDRPAKPLSELLDSLS